MDVPTTDGSITFDVILMVRILHITDSTTPISVVLGAIFHREPVAALGHKVIGQLESSMW